MERQDVFHEDFKIHLSVGSECVSIKVPAGQGLPNEVSIQVGNVGVVQQISKPVYVGNTEAKQSATILNSTGSCNTGLSYVAGADPSVNAISNANSKSVETSQNQEGEAPIISVDVSEDTENTITTPAVSLEEVFHTKYASKAHLYKHMCNALGKHVEFSDLTKPNLVKIKDYLSERVSINSVGLYCSTIKACMNLYAEEGVFNCKAFAQVLKHKRAPSMHVYLNEEEIHKIEQYVPTNRCENDVKIKFLIECYTGARLSDVEKMTTQDIKDGYVSYISKKTKVMAKIPVHKNLEQLLEAKTKATTSRSIYCRTIKKICQKCGIDEEVNIFYHGKQMSKPKWKFVGSHTARRSFATNLAVRNVPVQVISKMMGHSGDTKMTEKYILANIEAIDDNAMEFFK